MQSNVLNVLLVQLPAVLTWNRTVVPVNAWEQTARGAEMLGVTLGMVQPVTAVSHLCLVRESGKRDKPQLRYYMGQL